MVFPNYKYNYKFSGVLMSVFIVDIWQPSTDNTVHFGAYLYVQGLAYMTARAYVFPLSL